MTYDAPQELNRRVTRGRPASALLPMAVLAALVAGCASPTHRAPVEDRGGRGTAPVAAADAAVKPPPGQENLGKPGYYAVKPGDTLIRIGLENGQNWRDIARWNNLENPDRIEVGQVVRVVPPAAETSAVVVRPVLPPGRTEARPVGAPASGASTAASSATPSTSAPSAVATPAPSSPPPAARDGDDDLNWTWPASGHVAAGFDELRSKGLAITGKAGDPVFAAADGRVVYAGSGLRGYGNLIIVKHNATFLSAYAHNQTLLVKEDQVVRRGQKIAEMGSSDADRVQLHFEIRRQGKPVDPAKLLPSR